MYKFTDDNTLYAFAKTIAELINALQSKLEVVISYFKNNKMIVNPDKFQAMIIDKRKNDHSNETIIFDNHTIEAGSSLSDS